MKNIFAVCVLLLVSLCCAQVEFKEANEPGLFLEAIEPMSSVIESELSAMSEPFESMEPSESMEPVEDEGNENPRIVNGKPLGSYARRFIAHLYLDGAGCTGTLITPTAILTAAHCFNPFKTRKAFSYAYVGVEKADFSQKSHKYNIKGAYMHILWGEADSLGDIAVVILEKPVASWHGEPISWAHAPSVGSWVFPAGYGFANADEDPNSVAQYAALKIVDCPFPSKHPKDFFICYYSHTQSTCYGDSGGPVFWVNNDDKIVITGVHNKGEGQNCVPGKVTGVGAKLSTYVPWVNAVLGGDYSHARWAFVGQVTSPPPSPATKAFNLNVGGFAIGNRFLADNPKWVWGATEVSRPHPPPFISGAEEKNRPALPTHRWALNKGAFGYNIPVPMGTYECTLHWAETSKYHFGAGKRIFNVIFMGMARKGIDVYAAKGKHKSYTQTWKNVYIDGVMKIELYPVVGAPFLSAITCVRN